MTAQPRPPSHVRRVAGSTLLPRITAILAAVLLISASVTLLFETRQTRAALRSQALTRLEADATDIATAIIEQQVGAQGTIQTFGSVLDIASKDDDLQSKVDQLLASEIDEKALDVVYVYDLDGRVVAQSGTLRLTAPPRSVFTGSRSELVRIVELENRDRSGDLQYARVAIQRVDERIIVGGFALDESSAFDLRKRAGQAEVAIIVDGTVTGATRRREAMAGAVRGIIDTQRAGGLTGAMSGTVRLASDEAVGADPGDERSVREVTYFVAVSPVHVRNNPPGTWSHTAEIALRLEEPVAALDAQLTRTRTVSAVLLLGIAMLLGWVLFRRITHPLLGLAGTAQRIADGDLEATFEVKRRDEIGLLGDALERMRRALSSQLHLIGQQTDELQDSSRRMVGAQDAERQRIARDLHDGVQQQLVMLRIRLGFARAEIAKDPSALDRTTDELSAEIDRVIEQVRDTSQDIYPAILQDRGLQGALYSLAGRTAIPVHVLVDPDPLPRIDQDLAASAYFLIGEAVTNAHKHAEASRIDVGVGIYHDGTEVRISISDNGVGWRDAGGADAHGHRHEGGVAYMRDRAAAMLGELRLSTAASGGARVDATLRSRSVVAALEVEQDGSDTPVEVDVLA